MHPFHRRSRTLLHAAALVPFGAALLSAAPAWAQPQQVRTGAQLEEIIVKGQLIKSQASAYTATVLDTSTIREQSPSNIDQLLKLVPGMTVRDFHLGGVANSIVIRGFGNGGHGGDLGAVIDGIPLNEAMSHADGYVDLNVLVPLEIDSFTVLKGPVSAMYGNFNRGGLADIRTRKGGEYTEFDLAAGSFDTYDVQGALGTQLGDRQRLNLAGQLYRTEGHRPQSDSERVTLSGRWSAQVASHTQVSLGARYHTSDSDSASYMTRAQFERDAEGIDPRVHNDGAEKDFLSVRGDVSHELTPNLTLLGFAYTTEQDFTRWFTRPIDAVTWRQREETYDRSVFGAGTSLNGRGIIAGTEVDFATGVETFRESTEFQFYDALDYRVRTSPAASDRETSLNSISAFAEVQATLHPLVQLSLGLRADRFTGGCELLGAETGTDPCQSLNRANHVSPKIGVRSQVASWLQLRASWAEGFALPNGFVKYSVGGQPLDENVFRQTEVGLHLTAPGNLEFDLAAFQLDSTDEIRFVAPGIYENYGETQRRGVEAIVGWKPIRQLEVRAVYGLTDTEVTLNADTNLIGRSVPGVPDASATLETFFSPTPQWQIGAAWRWVDTYTVNALNTAHAEAYDVLDLSVAYSGGNRYPYRAYARVENVTDDAYASTISIIGGQQLAAPGALRAIRAGVQFNF